jgi:excisionase family DNA binding protein
MKLLNAATNALLSVPETAAALRVKDATVRSWILCRRIEVVRIGGRVFIKQETVQALVEKGTVPALKGHELV